MIKKYIEQGVLDERFPEVSALIKEGASIESIEKFAFERVQEAVECILYQLGDQESAECADVFDEIDCSKIKKRKEGRTAKYSFSCFNSHFAHSF